MSCRPVLLNHDIIAPIYWRILYKFITYSYSCRQIDIKLKCKTPTNWPAVINIKCKFKLNSQYICCKNHPIPSNPVFKQVGRPHKTSR